jgi:AcrR family transcriptional regulator
VIQFVGKEGSRGETLRTAQKQYTRERLVAAAVDLFVAKGYAATTVDDIATGAGATRATFYLHFRSKAELVRGLMQKMRAESLEVYRPLTEAVAAGSRERIRECLDLAFSFWEDIRPYSVAYEDAAIFDVEVRKDRSNVFREGVDAIIAGLSAAGKCPDEHSCRTRAVLAYSQLESLFGRWIRVGWDINRAEALEVMTDMWMVALVPG